MDTTPSPVQSTSAPVIQRVRHDIRRRTLKVSEVEDITPAMRRITLTGDDLADFKSLAPDDHIKIFVPIDGGGEERRDYTPRRYDNAARTLVLDFALHEAGPVTQWAIRAVVGDTLEIGGPRGSAVVSPSVTRWLLVGDETALPAIGRRIEESDAGSNITAVIAVASPAEQQTFQTRAQVACNWVYRSGPVTCDSERMVETLAGLDLPPQTFVWVAAEASAARAVRAYLLEKRGVPIGWIKASGYWVRGKADTTEKFD